MIAAKNLTDQKYYNQTKCPVELFCVSLRIRFLIKLNNYVATPRTVYPEIPISSFTPPDHKYCGDGILCR